VRDKKELFVFAELAVATAILWTQAEAPSQLFLVLASRLASPVPISVAEIHPQAAGGVQHFMRVAEYIYELGDELLGLPLQTKLACDAVIALPVERWRGDDSVHEDGGLAQPAKHLAHFAAKNQTVLVGVKRFLAERARLENVLRQHDRMLRASLLLFSRDAALTPKRSTRMQ